MKRIQAILGYTWAALALPIVMVMFVGMNDWAKRLASTTGVKISPWYSGGEIVSTNHHESYETRIHRPVFDGLIRERSRGFVQVDWVPRDSEGVLPAQINETIDYDGNGQADFRVELNSQTTTIVPLATNVIGLDKSYSLTHGKIIRIGLRKR